MLAGKFGDVALQVLRADLVERSLVSALEHRPERLDSVGVGHAVHVLAYRVLHAAMREREALVGGGVVGVDRGAFGHVRLDEWNQRRRVGRFHNVCADVVGSPILRANHGRLANRTTSRVGQRRALGVAHVPSLAAEVRLVHFDRPGVPAAAAVAADPRLADAVQHEPCGRLRDTQIAVQLHARHALEARQAEIDGDGPLAQRDVRSRDGRSSSDAEVTPAIGAPVRHGLAVWDFHGLPAPALPAAAATTPENGFEPLGSRFLGGKHIHEIDECQTLPLTTLYTDAELDPAERRDLRNLINDAWKEVYFQLGRNKSKPLNDDDFLRAHWMMYFKFSRQTGRDYIKFLLEEQFTPQRVHRKIVQPVELEEAEEQTLVRSCEYESSRPRSWTCDLLPPEASIDDELKRDILGARQRIVFVEGTAKSLDVPLYSLLFPQVSVIPKSSCRDVEHAVRGLREAAEMHWLHAWGIVDNDRRSEEDIERLRKLGVHALSHFSVESIYYHPEMIRRVAARQAEVTGDDPNELYEQAITDAIQAIQAQKDHLVLTVVERLVRQTIFAQLPTQTDIQSNHPVEIRVDVAALRTTEEDVFDVRVATSNLEDLLKYYPPRESGALTQIAKGVGLSKSKYESAVQKLLQDNDDTLEYFRGLFGGLASDINSVSSSK